MKNTLLFLLFLTLTSFQKNMEVSFHIVAKSGMIVNQRNNIVYFCTDGDKFDIERSVYDISLRKGTYAYINLDKSDTITFAIDETGAYKLGFQEDHGSFLILKESPFDGTL